MARLLTLPWPGYWPYFGQNMARLLTLQHIYIYIYISICMNGGVPFCEPGFCSIVVGSGVVWQECPQQNSHCAKMLVNIHLCFSFSSSVFSFPFSFSFSPTLNWNLGHRRGGRLYGGILRTTPIPDKTSSYGTEVGARAKKSRCKPLLFWRRASCSQKCFRNVRSLSDWRLKVPNSRFALHGLAPP